MSLRLRLLLATGLPLLAILVVISLIGGHMLRSTIHAAVDKELRTTAHWLGRMALDWHEDRMEDLASWALDPRLAASVSAADRTRLAAQLTALLEHHPSFLLLQVVDRTGAPIAASSGGLQPLATKDRAYLDAALGGKTAASSAFIHPASGKAALAMATPLRGEDGSVLGALIGLADLGGLGKKLVDGVTIGSTGYAFVIDRDGWAIAHPDPNWVMKLHMPS